MTANSAALMVTCPNCKSAPGEPCLGPQWVRQDSRSRRPLQFSRAHPSRAALAAVMMAGASPAQGLNAARLSVRAHLPEDEASVPYLDVALAAVRNTLSEATDAYRRLHPPLVEVPLPKPELELE